MEVIPAPLTRVLEPARTSRNKSGFEFGRHAYLQLTEANFRSVMEDDLSPQSSGSIYRQVLKE